MCDNAKPCEEPVKPMYRNALEMIDDIKVTMTRKTAKYRVPPVETCDLEDLYGQIVIKALRVREDVSNEDRIDDLRDLVAYALYAAGRIKADTPLTTCDTSGTIHIPSVGSGTCDVEPYIVTSTFCGQGDGTYTNMLVSYTCPHCRAVISGGPSASRILCPNCRLSFSPEEWVICHQCGSSYYKKKFKICPKCHAPPYNRQTNYDIGYYHYYCPKCGAFASVIDNKTECDTCHGPVVPKVVGR